MKKPIVLLSLDDTIHPRHSVSGANVALIKEAILAGIVMPPVLIDRATNKVIDGFHRVNAFRQLYGEDYEIEVTAKTYKDREAMLTDAMRLNVGRGADLTAWDRLRCVKLAEEVGMPITKLAGLLQWSPDRLVEYRENRTGLTIEGKKVELKRTLRRHLNKPLTKAQEDFNERAGGMNPLFYINQVVGLLETDLMPRDDHVVSRLKDLYLLIEMWIAENGFSEGDR